MRILCTFHYYISYNNLHSFIQLRRKSLQVPFKKSILTSTDRSVFSITSGSDHRNIQHTLHDMKFYNIELTSIFLEKDDMEGLNSNPIFRKYIWITVHDYLTER